MSELLDAGGMEWTPVRPGETRGVFGKTLQDGEVKVVLTRVAPGGSFAPHRDAWGHLFLVLTGQGRVRVGEKVHDVREGVAVKVAPGELHAYENTGSSDLTLISMNLPR